jgi:3-hydroxyisobutyrate dehydrogenase-like beta-hydroxyacid dehydrogenase
MLWKQDSLHGGSVGSGRLTKLINQLLFDINSTALAEVLPMDVKMGLDPAMMSDVINSGTGKSYASEFFIPRMHKGDFSAGYPVKEAYKDLVSAFPCRF